MTKDDNEQICKRNNSFSESLSTIKRFCNNVSKRYHTYNGNGIYNSAKLFSLNKLNKRYKIIVF